MHSLYLAVRMGETDLLLVQLNSPSLVRDSESVFKQVYNFCQVNARIDKQFNIVLDARTLCS